MSRLNSLQPSRRALPHLALMTAALVAGCGGGGGGGGNVLPPPSPPPGAVNWGAPVTLATNAGGITAPAAAIDGAGLAAVLWSQTGIVPAVGQAPLTSPHVVARENTAAGWAATQLIEAPVAGDAATDQVIDLQARGPAIGLSAVWLRAPGAGSNDRVRAVRRQAANDWDLVNVVSGPVGTPRSEVVIASNDSGVQAVAWVEPVAGVPQVQLRTRRIGVAGWTAPSLPVQSDAAIAGGQPALAVDANGLVMTVWRRGGANGELRARSYDAITNVMGDERVISTNQLDQRHPRVVAIGPNQFVAAWEQLSGTIYDLRSTRGTSAAWVANPPAVDARAESVGNAWLLAGPNAGALLLWQQADALFVSRSSAGSAWSQPSQVGANLAGVARDLRAGITATGNAILVWTQRGTNGIPDLYYATVTGTVPIATEATLLETEAGAAGSPALGVNANGQAVVAWLQSVAGQTQPNLVARVAR